MPVLGDLERAVFLSLTGFLILAAGIRAGLALWKRNLTSLQEKLRASEPIYSVRRLFWLVVILLSANWFFEINPKLLWFNGAQIVEGILSFRHVLLILLFFTILRQRHGYRYGAMAFAYWSFPGLSSSGSAILWTLVLLLVILFSKWEPWSELTSVRHQSARITWLVSGIIITTLAAGLIWEGGIKFSWRTAIRESAAAGTPWEKALAFVSLAQDIVPEIQLNPALARLVQRTSSGVAFFSHVLRRVPAFVPHENGALPMRAIGMS